MRSPSRSRCAASSMAARMPERVKRSMREATRGSNMVEGLLQIKEQVRHILNADGHADQTRADALAFDDLVGKPAAPHRRGLDNKAVDTAQAPRVQGKSERFDEAPAAFITARHFVAQQPAKGGHLPLSQFMLRVI